MKALIVVDLQNDFIEGGALPVKGGEELIDIINALMEDYECVLATKDWHPKNHISFASRFGKKCGEVVDVDGQKQILWPDHCIQGTSGADFPERLFQEKIEKVIYKGTDPDIDSYSGFFDNARKKETELRSYLKGRGVDEIDVVGLALDYCVKNTAQDGFRAGLKTKILLKATRSIQEDISSLLAELRQSGVILVPASHHGLSF